LVAERDRAIAARDQKIDDAAKLLVEEKRQAVDAAKLLEERKRQLAERDRIHAELLKEIARLNEAVNAKERIVSYRQSFRWWLALPWMRFKLWLEARH
jgi:type VI protein secretion system component VasK